MPYAAAKAGLHELARGLRAEYPWLRVTTFVVGPTITGFADDWDADRRYRDVRAVGGRRIPVHPGIDPRGNGGRDRPSPRQRGVRDRSGGDAPQSDPRKHGVLHS